MNKSNTVDRGDRFENRSYDIIKAAIEKLEFGMLPEYCKVFKKKKYYSKEIDDYIEFDLSIEVWPPGADDYIFVYLIECKDYGSPIPGSDVAEFINNIKLVEGLRVKAVLLTTTELQPRALKLVKSKKIMWIKIEGETKTTRLYNSRRKKNIYQDTDLPLFYEELAQLNEIKNVLFAEGHIEVDWNNLIEKFLKHSLEGNLFAPNEGTTGIVGLERLSGNLIQKIANRVLDDFDPNIRKNFLALNAEQFIIFLNDKYGVQVKYETIPQNNDRDNFGAFIAETKTILIDPSVLGTDRYKYVLAHEIGHFFLHNHLVIDQKIYDNLEDSRYNKNTRKYELRNERNFLEWQASKFASCLLMPDLSVMVNLMTHQYAKDIRNKGKMYVDNVPENIQIFSVTIDALRNFFGVSELVMEYRLGDLKIVRYGKNFRRPIPTYQTLISRTKTVGQLLGRAFNEMELNYLRNMSKASD
jgi:Zn-dependent peptidase ImmA (M78 family)